MVAKSLLYNGSVYRGAQYVIGGHSTQAGPVFENGAKALAEKS